MNDVMDIAKELNIAIGKLRHRITIQYPNEDTLDSQGNPVITWTDLDTFGDEGTVWASIEPIRSRELFEIKQTQSEVTHRIRMRYYSGLLTKYRILFGTRIFNIDSIINVQERNILLEILAIEKT